MSLEFTPLDEIPVRVKKLNDSFHTRKFDDVEVRINCLRDLYFAIKDHEDLLIKAIKRDLNKSSEEFQITELSTVYSDLLYIISNLREWVKPSKPSAVPLLFKFSKPSIEFIPLGTILVIGAFNFPLILTLQPVIGAIAAGNTVIVKQSEQVPYTTAVISEMLMSCLDNELVQCIDGGVEETTLLLEQHFDKVIYTGSGQVGKIISKKCSETLTPCLLELGGKSPAFITKNCPNLDIAAKRIVYVTFANAGQICVTVDYAIVDKDIYEDFIKLVLKWVKKLYGDVNADTFNKLVSTKSTERVLKLIEGTKGEVIYTGDHDLAKRYIHPTVIKDVTFSDCLMESEIFGPILPIIKYDDLSEVITEVITHCDTPLALYAFTNCSKELNLIRSRIRSGGFVANDAMIHVGMSQLPFGGVGTSGYGNYHGYNSFKAFSHERSSLNQPYWIEPLFEAKYPPTSSLELMVAKTAMVPPAWFGRTGKVKNWKKIFKNTFISLFLATGLLMGYNSKKEDKFFGL